ncbi:MAG: MFS transporter [bacterium]
MFKNNPKLKNIFFLGFLLSLHIAFTAYTSSTFISLFSGESNVSFVYIASSIITIFALFYVPKMLRRVGEYKFLLWSSFLNAAALLLIALVKTPLVVIPLFLFYFTLNSMIIFALDELVQIFSKNSNTGAVRGLYLTVSNLAWVVAQIISGIILSSFAISAVYLIAFFVMVLFCLIAWTRLDKISDPKYDKGMAWHTFKKFFRNKNLTRAYAINFLLQFFYVWMVIYTPIYLHTYVNFNWSELSIIFTVMLLPFILIQFPSGEYSDKIGERQMLMLGFAIASVSTTAIFFIQGHNIWIWAIILFCTRVGAAIIEVMSDVYFFKHINTENDEFIAVYRNTAPMSYIIAPLLAFFVFEFAPSFNFIFLILGAILLYGICLSSKIKKSDI